MGTIDDDDDDDDDGPPHDTDPPPFIGGGLRASAAAPVAPDDGFGSLSSHEDDIDLCLLFQTQERERGCR